jgi:hypothetical protein
MRTLKNRLRRDRHAGENRNPRSRHGQHIADPGYIAGQHWVVCHRCGFDYYVRDIKVEWTGAFVCEGCWEPRHPQDYVRGKRDKMRVSGAVNPASDYDTTAAAGSTTVPSGTFNDETL